MESIEKLRTAARNMAKGRNLEHHEECNLLLRIADQIEAEIAEKYMELPTDADGVPIKAFDEIEQGRVAVVANDSGGQYVFIPRGFERGCYLLEAVKADTCHHVKPRTLDDVLCEMVVDARNDLQRDFSVAAYAAEIRELLGVSE